MPIQFRCKHCGQMLSISSRKMGATVNCPACTEPILVPGDTPPTAQLDSTQARSAPPSRPAGLPPAPKPTAPSPPVAIQTPVAPRTPAAVQPPILTSQPAAKPPLVAAASPSQAPRENQWADEEEDEDAPRKMRASRLSNDGLDMTPMVDVTFQLLIFFMITASFVTQKSLQTTPPEPNDDTGAVAVQLEDMQDQSVIVNIDAEGAMLVDDVPIEGASALVETLMAKMATEQKSQLLIEADYNAKHGAIIQVIDAGITAGMENIRKTSRQDE